MERPKISIITPVYNSAKTLEKLLDSVIQQSFKDWELIAIDDGSTDMSYNILSRYSSQDNRIKPIRQQNSGVSAARQKGIDTAIGTYIIHADSDDYMESEMLTDLYTAIIQYDADLLICDYYVNTHNATTIVNQKPSSIEPQIVRKELFEHMHGSCCNKLLRKSCIIKYNVGFPVGLNYCEDRIFWIKLLSNDNIKITYLPKAYYHYCINDSSITRNYTKTLYEQSRLMIKILEDIYPNDQYKEQIIDKQKMIIKFAAFTHSRLFSSNEYYNIYPELNNKLKTFQTSYVNNILLQMSCIKGFFKFASWLYCIKCRITNHK